MFTNEKPTSTLQATNVNVWSVHATGDEKSQLFTKFTTICHYVPPTPVHL